MFMPIILFSKLLSLDCFSRKFIESILNLVHRSKHSTSDLACKLYIDITKRMMPDGRILTHILEFYISHVVIFNVNFLHFY